MESGIFVLLLLVFLFLGVILIGGILGCVAMAKVAAIRRELTLLRGQLDRMQSQFREGQRPVAPAVSQPIAPVSAANPEKPQPAAPAVPPVATAPQPRPAVIPAPMPAPSPISKPLFVPRPAAPNSLANLESSIALRWLAYAGALFLFLTAVFFLKYAFQNDWIGPTGQIAICALGAAAVATAGSRFINKNWRILGQSLVGLGLAILYATFYAAFNIYSPPVMGQAAAFAFMVGVTVVGIGLAIMHDAVSLAFIAVLGGILTPILVSTGQDSRDTLFTYLLILNLGVIAVAFFRSWRLLDTLAMVGTFILYASWFSEFYKPAGMSPALAWLGAFYLVYLLLPFLYHLVRRTEIPIERFLMAITNAAFCASFAWHMLRIDYLFIMGFVALAMAAAYLVLGAAIRRRLPNDPRALFGTIAMTVTFLTLAIPMQLHAQGILLAWVAEAPVLCVLAYRFRYFPVRVFGAIILVLGVGRLFFYHWPLHHEAFVPFFNRHFLSALAVPAAAAAYVLVHQFYKDQATLADRTLKIAAALGGGLLALIIFHAEIYGWLEHDFNAYAAANAVTALWAAGAFAYLFSGARAPQSAAATWAVGAFTLFIAAVLGVSMYDNSHGPGPWLFANPRFAAGLLLAAATFAYAWVIHRFPSTPASAALTFANAFLVVALVGLLILLSTEVYTFCSDLLANDYTLSQRAGQMSISLVWSLYAGGLILVGFWQRFRALRLAGLALFGLAALKLVVVDLNFLKDIYRIVSFFVLGLFMIAASYLYHRLEKRLAGTSPPAAPQPVPPAGETA